MVEAWEADQPALILWRGVANFAVAEELDWTPVVSDWMLLGADDLTVR